MNAKQLCAGGEQLLNKINYVLVNSEILPEVYIKVLKAKELLASGEAKNASAAAKMAGVSRTAYYKYKDAVFEYRPESEELATIDARLADTAGVLSGVMNEIYKAGGNILSVNQSVPVNGVAAVSITVRIAEMSISENELMQRLVKMNGVKSAALS